MEAIEAAVAADADRRPTPEAFGSALQAACEASPVWLPGSGPEVGGLTHRIRVLSSVAAEPPPGRRHRARAARRPPALLGAGVLGVVAVLLAAAWLFWPRPNVSTVSSQTAAPAPSATRTLNAASGTASPSVAEPPSTEALTADRLTSPVGQVLSADDARAAVEALGRRRAGLFADPGLPLTTVAVAGSAAAREDGRAVAQLRRQGVAYRGLAIRTEAARLVTATPDRAVVVVRSSVSAFDVVNRSGVVVQRMPATAPGTTRLVLRRTMAGWRVASVLSS